MYPIWVVHILVLFATVITYLDTTLYFKTIETERNKQQLEYSVNSASDAAIEELLKTTREANGSSIVDPNHIWNVYKYTFLRSVNMHSDSMMSTIESSFPSVVIAVNDGYYTRLLVDIEKDGVTRKEYVFTQKLPYARTTKVPTTVKNGPAGLTQIPEGKVVADTMDGTDIWVYELQNNVRYSVVNQGLVSQKSVTGSAHDLRDINLMLLNAIEYNMFHNSAAQNNRAGLTIPDAVSTGLTSDNVNFVGPTIFAFSDNFSFRGQTYFNYYSVGGSQIVKATNYYTYTRGGNKYYSKIHPQNIPGATLNSIVTNPTDAAIDGYSPDPVYY